MAFALLVVFGMAAPFVVPDYTSQISVMWVMILMALTWDLQGGQMGYNSLGNIFFFGAGMYISAVVQIAVAHDVGAYTDSSSLAIFTFTEREYYTGLALGITAAGVGSAALALPLGWIVFGLRGPYFAVGTLGIAIAAGELVSAWNWVGGGSGISMPTFPGSDPASAKQFFYACNFVSAIATFVVLRWLYGTRFGTAINAIRDDEEKAEGMGLHTARYKALCWAISAFFLGICGAVFGNMIGFIEPLEVAFQVTNFGIFMVVMVLLGGKGTLWGPVVGAILFHFFKELTWTYLLGWQWVALGTLIILIVVYFQDGLIGWLRRLRPEWFGIGAQDRNIEMQKSADRAGESAAEAVR